MDGSYARIEATDGYIAAVFHPTLEENAEPFTAVIGVRAWLDQSGKQPVAKEEQTVFFVLPDVELDLDAFMYSQGDTPHIVLLDEIQQKLIGRFGKRAVERYDHKRAYLRRLYGALRGKRGFRVRAGGTGCRPAPSLASWPTSRSPASTSSSPTRSSIARIWARPSAPCPVSSRPSTEWNGKRRH